MGACHPRYRNHDVAASALSETAKQLSETAKQSIEQQHAATSRRARTSANSSSSRASLVVQADSLLGTLESVFPHFLAAIEEVSKLSKDLPTVAAAGSNRSTSQDLSALTERAQRCVSQAEHMMHRLSEIATQVAAGSTARSSKWPSDVELGSGALQRRPKADRALAPQRQVASLLSAPRPLSETSQSVGAHARGKGRRNDDGHAGSGTGRERARRADGPIARDAKERHSLPVARQSRGIVVPMWRSFHDSRDVGGGGGEGGEVVGRRSWPTAETEHQPPHAEQSQSVDVMHTQLSTVQVRRPELAEPTAGSDWPGHLREAFEDSRTPRAATVPDTVPHAEPHDDGAAAVLSAQLAVAHELPTLLTRNISSGVAELGEAWKASGWA
jgi:hypothetical protein